MTLVTIKIPDETFDKYVEHNKANPRKAMEETLVKYQDSPAYKRVLVLSDEQRGRLEKLWSSPIENLDQFVEWIEKIHSIDVIGVKVPLTHNQANQLASQAHFYHKSPKQYIEEKVLQLLKQNVGV